MKKIIALFIVVCLLLAIGLTATAETVNLFKSMQGYKTAFWGNYSLPDDDWDKVNPGLPTLYLYINALSKDILMDPGFEFMCPDSNSVATNITENDTDPNALAKDLLIFALILNNSKIDGDITIWAEKLKSMQEENGTFGDYLDATVWSAIALNAASYFDKSFTFDRNLTVNGIKSFMSENGSYNVWDMTIDTTAMAILALKALDTPEADVLIEKSLGYLKYCLQDDGFFLGTGDWDSKNSCSQAIVISTLVACGEDLDSAKWAGVVDALLSLMSEDGLFWYDEDSKNGLGWFEAPDHMSSLQGITALSDIQNGSLYAKFKAIPNNTTTTIENNTTTIENTTAAVETQLEKVKNAFATIKTDDGKLPSKVDVTNAKNVETFLNAFAELSETDKAIFLADTGLTAADIIALENLYSSNGILNYITTKAIATPDDETTSADYSGIYKTGVEGVNPWMIVLLVAAGIVLLVLFTYPMIIKKKKNGSELFDDFAASKNEEADDANED